MSAVQLDSNPRSVSTGLSEPQVREAESVFARLPARGRPVAFFFDLGAASHREPLRQRPLTEAVDDYLATKAQEHGYGLILDHERSRALRRRPWTRGFAPSASATWSAPAWRIVAPR